MCKWLILQNTEWEQFQKDLLLTVRVANDFKTEAQAEVEKVLLENKCLRDKIRTLDTQIEQLNAQIEQLKSKYKCTLLATNERSQKVV